MDKDKTRFILYQDLVYLSAMIITDFLKITEKYNLTEYNFIQGHLADIGLSGVLKIKEIDLFHWLFPLFFLQVGKL